MMMKCEARPGEHLNTACVRFWLIMACFQLNQIIGFLNDQKRIKYELTLDNLSLALKV
jgi:hypothetical protein